MATEFWPFTHRSAGHVFFLSATFISNLVVEKTESVERRERVIKLGQREDFACGCDIELKETRHRTRLAPPSVIYTLHSDIRIPGWRGDHHHSYRRGPAAQRASHRKTRNYPRQREGRRSDEWPCHHERRRQEGRAEIGVAEIDPPQQQQQSWGARSVRRVRTAATGARFSRRACRTTTTGAPTRGRSSGSRSPTPPPAVAPVRPTTSTAPWWPRRRRSTRAAAGR